MVANKLDLQKRQHRERSQPLKRQKLGLLEKHADYVKRARDFHSKEDRIKKLREKASGRNKDEFYFGMIKSKTIVSFSDSSWADLEKFGGDEIWLHLLNGTGKWWNDD